MDYQGKFNRFRTINLSYSAELMNYRQNDFNNLDGVMDESDFLTFNNKVELSAYFDQEKRSGVFARGVIVNALGDDDGDGFFQFQLGVTFSFGFQKVSAN